MVITCIVKGCDNKQKVYSAVMFHRIPTHHKRRKAWLAALDMDPTTSVDILKNWRVCSEHFTQKDYTSTGLRLKDAATPTILKSGTQQSGSPNTLHDTGEEMDGSPDEVKGPGNQANVSETCATTTEKPTLQHIVDEEAIMQLMKNCPMCDRKCRCNKRTQGPYFIVYQSCYFCNYQRKWANQPEARNMNIYNSNKPKPKKPKPKDKVSGNAKAQSSQTNKTSISESSVSDSHDPSET
ncbi:uncharacterized protein LOC131977324 isoform X1 [Centropristis striata]|uniref:uncharacterized protein LOC131977324 isoform X1 n=1 Tax=Centropristis striata TaxID=184440 RepID=UPI0027DFA782|nr:uncharacterized protein LOC131977324 isoform X1 [Centropristis striata]